MWRCGVKKVNETGAVRNWILLSTALLAVALGGFVLWMHSRSTATPPRPPLTAEARGYFGQIEITGVRMSVASNFLGSTLYYLDAQMTNKGLHAITRLDLYLEFFDAYHQVVYHQTAQALSAAKPALKPGETRPLHLTFENMPGDWNQAAPGIQVSYLMF